MSMIVRNHRQSRGHRLTLHQILSSTRSITKTLRRLQVSAKTQRKCERVKMRQKQRRSLQEKRGKANWLERRLRAERKSQREARRNRLTRTIANSVTAVVATNRAKAATIKCATSGKRRKSTFWTTIQYLSSPRPKLTKLPRASKQPVSAVAQTLKRIRRRSRREKNAKTLAKRALTSLLWAIEVPLTAHLSNPRCHGRDSRLLRSTCLANLADSFTTLYSNFLRSSRLNSIQTLASRARIRALSALWSRSVRSVSARTKTSCWVTMALTCPSHRP